MSEFDDPNHPIFKSQKWLYAFELSDGSSTETHSPYAQAWHEKRRKVIFERLERHVGSLKNLDCLDIACNAGFWSMELAARGANVEAFDYSAGAVRQAQAIVAHRHITNASFQIADVFTLDPDKQFDVILCCGLIYHLTDPLGACKRIKSWSKGIVVFDTAVSDLDGPVLEIGSPDKYCCCTQDEFAFIPTPPAFEAILQQAGFARFERVVRDSDAYSKDHIRALWLAWPD